MKRNTLFLLILWFQQIILSAAIPAPSDPSDDFYIKMIGTIGDLPVHMDLQRAEGKIYGSYYYDRIGIPLRLSGEKLSDGRFRIREFNAKEIETGTFTGRLTANRVFEGSWQNGSKRLPFRLEEGKAGFASATVRVLHRRICDRRDRYTRNPDHDANGVLDTACSKYDVRWMEFTLENSGAARKINQSMLKSCVGFTSAQGYATDISQWLNSIKEDEDFGQDMEIRSGVMTNENNILAVSVTAYMYSHGAAHGDLIAAWRNYDIRSGEVIRLNQCLTPGYEKQLNAAARSELISAYGADAFQFEAGFSVGEDVAFTREGLLCLWQKFDLGPSPGMLPSVLIPYSKISGLIRPDGPLAGWQRK